MNMVECHHEFFHGLFAVYMFVRPNRILTGLAAIGTQTGGRVLARVPVAAFQMGPTLIEREWC